MAGLGGVSERNVMGLCGVAGSLLGMSKSQLLWVLTLSPPKARSRTHAP